ncbi:MAG: carbohydrate binding domain-containing protein [Candidatus Methanoperedens sp.]|nr:carbohydrate binding domain-containing protein [Candidatus Methanoperedens sp.]
MNVKIMNQIKFVLFMTLTLLLTISGFASSASADTNLIANPGFESGSTIPLNWNLVTYSGNTPSWDTVSHSGARSVQIQITGTSDIISGEIKSDIITAQPNTEYNLSVWGKTQGAGGTNTPAVRVVELDANKNWLSQSNLPAFSRGTNDWVQKQINFQTRSNTAYIYIYANIWKGYGIFWLDDVELKLKSTTVPTSTPTPTLAPAPTQPGVNLIANSGFESGSTTPLNWNLVTYSGNTPSWDTVSHSGARSVQIQIIGTSDIISGEIKSDIITAQPNTEYNLSVWGKTQGAGGRNAPAVRVVELDANKNWLSQNNLPAFSSGTNDWVQKQINFQTRSNTAYIYIYANIWNGYGIFWLDDVELKLKSTTVPTQSPTPMPTSGSAIQINADKTISINGKKTFPVFMNNICNPYHEDTAGVEPCDPSKNSEFKMSGDSEYISSYARSISKYEQAGILYWMYAGQINNMPQNIMTSPYLFGYYHIDEPTDDQIPQISNAYKEVKAKDPNHPVILGHWRDMTKWALYADIMVFGLYPIKNTPEWPREDSIYVYEHSTENNFLKGTSLSSFSKPVYAIIQAFGRKDVGEPPTPKEARSITYTAITMNVNGIGYYSYLGWGDGQLGGSGLYWNQSLHTYYRQLGKELTSLNDIFVLPTKDYSWEYRKGTMVSFSKNPNKQLFFRDRQALNYMLKQSGSIWYLIVVNKDPRPITDVGITINGLTGAMTATTLGLEATGSQRAGRKLGVNNGQFTDSFDGYAAHIYKVS